MTDETNDIQTMTDTTNGTAQRGSQRYLTEDNRLQWERVTDMLVDITDGYLSNINGVDYQVGGGAAGLFRRLGDDDRDVDPDLVGSRLLKSVSQLHSIAINHTIRNNSETEVLYRLAKFSPVASKLSDEYAMSDEMYRQQWHDDVVQICEAIRMADQSTRSDTPQETAP